MPPIRTPSTINTKGLKTERTHEENQERAYIAASRRSDRSLEARMESARRASEIHKKRTGRGLRVTEEDVMNEEMYEEEDEDIASQYRRLQAHLGNSAHTFNGRLNAYLATQVGMRQMAMAAQMGQMPPPGGMDPNMFQMNNMTPFFQYSPQPNQQPPLSPSGTLSPSATQRGHFRQSPYPVQHRSSMSGPVPPTTPQLNAGQADGNASSPEPQTMDQHRRHSMSGSENVSVPSTPKAQDNSMRPPMARPGSFAPNMQPGRLGHLNMFNDQFMQNPMSANLSGYPANTSSYDPMNSMQSPLTTALPVEAQQMLGSSFDHFNPYASMMMNSSHGMPIPPGVNYSYNPNLSVLSKHSTNSEGIHQTLSPNRAVQAPVKVDTSVDSMSTPGLTANQLSASSDGMNQYSAVGNDYGLGLDFVQSPYGGVDTPNQDGHLFNDWLANDSDSTII